MMTLGGSPYQPPRCECHECTQARWKMSFHGQINLGQAIPSNGAYDAPTPEIYTKNPPVITKGKQ